VIPVGDVDAADPIESDMVLELFATGLVPAAVYLYLRHDAGRRLARLEAAQPDVVARGTARLALPDTPPAAPAFDEHIAVIPDLLPADVFAVVRDAAARVGRVERSYVPAHKKGATVSYEALHALAPELVALYHSPFLAGLVSAIAGAAFVPTPVRDQSSCSLLCYERSGDRIGWHYDHNFYDGRHLTALLSIVNEGSSGSSSARLVYESASGVRELPTPPNTFVLFEGALVRHAVTRLGAGERRVVLSMTYCTSPTCGPLRGALRRIKDTAYYGVRALWT
jgi:hypothetical protein